MVLNTGGVEIRDPDSLHRTIVQIQLRNNRCRTSERIRRNCVPVVLARNRHLATLKILNRVIATPVTKFEFKGTSSYRLAKELVA